MFELIATKAIETTVEYVLSCKRQTIRTFVLPDGSKYRIRARQKASIKRQMVLKALVQGLSFVASLFFC